MKTNMTYQKELFLLKEMTHKRMSSTEAMKRCLQHMLLTDKHWFFAHEFVGNTKGGWLSYKAPARLSDLVRFYPKLVTSEKVGRLKVYRLKVKRLPKWAVDNSLRLLYK